MGGLAGVSYGLSVIPHETDYSHTSLIRILSASLSLGILLNMRLKFFLNIKGTALSDNQKTILKCLLKSYFFIKRQKSVAEQHMVYQQCKSSSKSSIISLIHGSFKS